MRLGACNHLPGLDLHRAEIETFGVEADMAPEGVERAERLHAELVLPQQHLHPGPEALERVEEGPRDLRGRHVYVDVPAIVGRLG